MLIDAPGPDWARRLFSDEHNGILFERGRRTIVDGVNFPRTRGAVVVSLGRAVAGGTVRLTVKGQIVVRARQRPRIRAFGATIHALDETFMELFEGADGHAYMRSTFVARKTSHVHIYDEASGDAFDEATVFFHEGARGRVKRHGPRVVVVAPPGRLIDWNDDMTEARLGAPIAFHHESPLAAAS